MVNFLNVSGKNVYTFTKIDTSFITTVVSSFDGLFMLFHLYPDKQATYLCQNGGPAATFRSSTEIGIVSPSTRGRLLKVLSF